MASLIEQIEAVRAAFEASDKGFEARKAAWVAVAPIAEKVAPADPAALPLVTFVKRDLVAAGPWPTEAKAVLVALLKFRLWIDVYDAGCDLTRAQEAYAAAVEKARERG